MYKYRRYFIIEYTYKSIGENILWKVKCLL